MTRKRFIKKLMGVGFSRNESNEIAVKSRKSGASYQVYYEYNCSWLRISIAMKKVGNSFKKVSKAISFTNSTMMSFNEAMCAIAQSNN